MTVHLAIRRPEAQKNAANHEENREGALAQTLETSLDNLRTAGLHTTACYNHCRQLVVKGLNDDRNNRDYEKSLNLLLTQVTPRTIWALLLAVNGDTINGIIFASLVQTLAA